MSNTFRKDKSFARQRRSQNRRLVIFREQRLLEQIRIPHREIVPTGVLGPQPPLGDESEKSGRDRLVVNLRPTRRSGEAAQPAREMEEGFRKGVALEQFV